MVFEQYEMGVGDIDTTEAKNRVVIKYPFQNPLFREDEKLLSWPFSNTILTTAYNLLRDDFLISHLQKTGGTLKEYLHDLGFNRNVKILADTGIFAFEFLKSLIPVGYPIEVPEKLDTDEILMAYELIDPDYLVAPDEIILLEDNEKVMMEKMYNIEVNLEKTVDRFPKNKIVATIQGVEDLQIKHLSRIIQENGIKRAARGGLLPLRRNKPAFERVLKQSESIARDHGITHLHGFGLPGIPALNNYFVKNSYNTIDTAVIYYYTADMKYINEQGALIPINKVYFNDCGCMYCRRMLKLRYRPESGGFMINLYCHNSQMMVKLTAKLLENPEMNIARKKWYPRTIIEKDVIADYGELFTNASNIEQHEKRVVDNSLLHMQRQLILTHIKKPVKGMKKVLIISMCSKKKRIKLKDQPGYDDLDTPEKRKKVKQRFIDMLFPAVELYDGYEHNSMRRAVRELRKKLGKNEVDHYIVSGGFGFINEHVYIPPYDSTFMGRSDNEIVKMGINLQLKKTINQLKHRYQMVYLALNDTYLMACGDLNTFKHLGNEIIIFTNKENVYLPFVKYDRDEFLLMENNGKKFDPELEFTLKFRGNILINFAKSLPRKFDNDMKDKIIPSFTRYWHSLMDCTCEK